MNVAAIIFDMDGLMLDTEPLYKAAWQHAAFQIGYDLDDAAYAQFVGRRTEDCEALLLGGYGADFPLDAFRARWPQLWRAEAGRVGIRTKPGLRELLSFIEAHRLSTAVATSSEAGFVEESLRLAGLAGHFETIVTGEQVKRGKPAPDIYLEAARRLNVPPAQCVALEDSEAGIVAAASAGMMALLVPHWPPSERAELAAFRVLTSLDDAIPLLASLLRET